MITVEDIKPDDMIFASPSSIYGKTCLKLRVTAVGRKNFLAIRDMDGAEICLDAKCLKSFHKNDQRKIMKNSEIGQKELAISDIQ